MDENHVQALAEALYDVIFRPMETSGRPFEQLGPQQQEQLRGTAHKVLVHLAVRIAPNGTPLPVNVGTLSPLNGHGARRRS
jgi:hypothetical protein